MSFVNNNPNPFNRILNSTAPSDESDDEMPELEDTSSSNSASSSSTSSSLTPLSNSGVFSSSNSMPQLEDTSSSNSASSSSTSSSLTPLSNSSVFSSSNSMPQLADDLFRRELIQTEIPSSLRSLTISQLMALNPRVPEVNDNVSSTATQTRIADIIANHIALSSARVRLSNTHTYSRMSSSSSSSSSTSSSLSSLSSRASNYAGWFLMTRDRFPSTSRNLPFTRQVDLQPDSFTAAVQQRINNTHSSATRVNSGDFFVQLINSDLEKLKGEERANYIKKFETFDSELICELIKKAIEQVCSGTSECPSFLKPYLNNFTVSYEDGFKGSPNYKKVDKPCQGLQSIRILEDDDQRNKAIDEIIGQLLKDVNCTVSLQQAFSSVSSALSSSAPATGTVSSSSSLSLSSSLSSNATNLSQPKEDSAESKRS